MRCRRISKARFARAPVIALVNAIAFGALIYGISCIACGGATESTDNATVYRAGQVAFKLPVLPAMWKSINVTHASLSFRDEAHDASILINGRCTRIDGDTPLMALTNQLLMGTTEREIASQSVEPFDGREALHSRLVAKLDGVPFAFDIFVLKKDGCVYDFVYLASQAAIDEGAPTFEAFVHAFHTLPGSGAT